MKKMKTNDEIIKIINENSPSVDTNNEINVTSLSTLDCKSGEYYYINGASTITVNLVDNVYFRLNLSAGTSAKITFKSPDFFLYKILEITEKTAGMGTEGYKLLNGRNRQQVRTYGGSGKTSSIIISFSKNLLDVNTLYSTGVY